MDQQIHNSSWPWHFCSCTKVTGTSYSELGNDIGQLIDMSCCKEDVVYMIGFLKYAADTLLVHGNLQWLLSPA